MQILADIYILFIILSLLIIIIGVVWLYFVFKKYQNVTAHYEKEMYLKKMVMPILLIALGILVMVTAFAFLDVINGD